MKNFIALGTAQFGGAYGISNPNGLLDTDQVREILRISRDRGVSVIDTAIAYGESESRLGIENVSGFDVITKLPEIPSGGVSAWIREQLRGSLARLSIPRLYGVLLHRPEQLVSPDGPEIYDALCDLKNEGVVEKIGASIYDPSELDAWFSEFPVDLIQAPFNPIDRRLHASGWLQRLVASGVEVHARSVFLQGLLLMRAHERPAQFSHWEKIFTRWDEWCARAGRSPLEACLGFVRSHDGVTHAVVGVDHAEQWREVLDARTGLSGDWPDVASIDRNLIDPRTWSTA